MNRLKNQKGFTLVEIAIVLVIIGLLLGGVLKGQQLIENTKYKNFVQQINGYRSAVYSFQDRYKALPGDFALATTKLTAPSGVTIVNGNGNGAIEGGYCDAANEESCIVWQHLILAGFLGGDASQTGTGARKTHTYGGFISSISTGTWANNRNDMKILMNGVPGKVAQRYDDEFDDGNATSGDVARYGGTGATYADTPLDVFVTL
jgi:prepilin-type N-terminal cleavage/methylation domain-containing protein